MNDTTSGGETRMREQMHGARYGEVLLVNGHINHIEATVYNTLGLNDCPDDLWRALDSEAIAREHHARAVILNGPRYFLRGCLERVMRLWEGVVLSDEAYGNSNR